MRIRNEIMVWSVFGGLFLSVGAGVLLWGLGFSAFAAVLTAWFSTALTAPATGLALSAWRERQPFRARRAARR